jgi:hypothetical protein
MDEQGRTCDTMLVKSREMTGWLEGEVGKDDRKQKKLSPIVEIVQYLISSFSVLRQVFNCLLRVHKG